MTYPLVRDLAADGIPVTVACRVLKFSPQAFYAWCAHPVSDRDLVDAYAMNAAYEIHAEDPGLGYRFIADELADAGHALSERRVWKICHQGQIVSAHSRTRGRWKKPGPPVHDDLVQRDFTAEAPNRLWLTDITEHPTAEGKLYLCAVKDVWSRRIVGYSINDRMTSQLAVDALEMAIARRGRDTTAGCVVHADRGSQFRSRTYLCALHRHGLTGSMGRVASSADNAAMESFFALVQKNVLNSRRWATREQLRLAIVTWIERTYHRRRRQRALGKTTPIEFETIYWPAHAA
ncbi:Integrase core domain [Kytococcus sedentarius]|uniref:Transposase n=1 Tax=Kytococcus sedentarius (strain ATCC 14392 / DSM 20547 / JCM 11482 / CCUG 33030 / NBRC 15357 / NCTC 11040 / CCM 314 / 541) TaxID=478801 RepID=C7NF74_KYTSD|nr:transposase [Kytococcus sedentarius DSM 20547]STX13832.1 Integrase core domain [Kytococcus sedentarius]